MNFSIRSRLTFWYVSMLTVSLIVFGLSFFYAMSKVYMESVDKQIHSVASIIAHNIVRPPGELVIPRNFDLILEKFFGIRTGGNYIQILNARGKIVGKSATLEGFELPVTQEVLFNAKKGILTYEVDKKFGVYPIRVVSMPVKVKGVGLVATVQVGASLGGMEEVYHDMIYFFVIGVIASILVASFVGYFLARAALKPVAGVTRMARRIGAENLDERLVITGPEDEIGRLAHTFNNMIMRLERSFNRTKQFTEDASHELKTPLTVMKGEIEVALRGDDDAEELKEALRSTLEEIDRMNLIVRNLLVLARADVEREAGAKTIIGFDTVVGESFEQCKKIAAIKRIKLGIRHNAQVTGMADPVRFGQVVYNLIDNAIKYTHEEGEVEISLEQSGGWAILTVKDTGIGIAKEDIPFVFDRFWREDKARTRSAGGVGLGLSICKEIIESMEGVIEVESEQGVGTTFTVRIPVSSDEGVKYDKP